MCNVVANVLEGEEEERFKLRVEGKQARFGSTEQRHSFFLSFFLSSSENAEKEEKDGERRRLNTGFFRLVLFSLVKV